HISNDGSLDEEIKCRNNQGRQEIRQLNSILWDKAVSKQNKHKIYNSIIKSIIVMVVKRASVKLNLDRVRNERIQNIMGVKHRIMEDIKINQLRWYGHVQRMEDSRIPKKILNWTQDKRKRGRPRRSWREGIDGDIRTRGIDENLWTETKGDWIPEDDEERYELI
ncbi:uncharacterized protein LOC115877353, partial [Sitophilus oryzae]|uniref:Uncharacterized protein LOC115877353 n=1 Tax=Sitophilus oryzae TaxID=7048 RepID=A0A6J2XDE5_SITOR